MIDTPALRERPTEDWIASLRQRFPTEPAVDQTLTEKLMRRRERKHYSSPPLEIVGERLNRFLETQVEGPFTVRNLRPLTGGASKEQFLFDLDWSHDGERRQRETMVLRCEPAASIVQTSRRREFELMQFGGTIIPAPPVYFIDEDGSQMGTPSLVSGFVRGVTKPSKVSSNVSGIGTHFTQEYREGLAPDYVRCMVELHRATVPADALPSFVHPREGTTEAADLAVNWWSRTWAEDLYEDTPIAVLTQEWLRGNAPILDRLSVVHGDFRTGNFLFDEATGEITAVLDWELGYLGDRHADLAYILTDFYVTREDGKPFHCGMFESEAQLLDAYAAAGGLPIDPQKLAWHKVLSTWKQFVLSLGCALRAGDGQTHQDVLLSFLAAGGYTISEALRRLLEKHG
ncbi:phosphotransferase family protein [Sphingomonas sp. ID0503]|uniref:phosphotransferase family protein n=1 Tax=Sphingomonas sp. ID0503 TaxID=3399691 RepID=UPI003AFA8C2B